MFQLQKVLVVSRSSMSWDTLASVTLFLDKQFYENGIGRTDNLLAASALSCSHCGQSSKDKRAYGRFWQMSSIFSALSTLKLAFVFRVVYYEYLRCSRRKSYIFFLSKTLLFYIVVTSYYLIKIWLV